MSKRQKLLDIETELLRERTALVKRINSSNQSADQLEVQATLYDVGARIVQALRVLAEESLEEEIEKPVRAVCSACRRGPMELIYRCRYCQAWRGA